MKKMFLISSLLVGEQSFASIMRAAKIYLERDFKVYDLSLGESVILKEHVYNAAIQHEKEVKNNVKSSKLFDPALEGVCKFLFQEFGLKPSHIQQIWRDNKFANFISLSIENERHKRAFPDGLDRRPLYEEQRAKELRRWAEKNMPEIKL